jgi:hypothetical protein
VIAQPALARVVVEGAMAVVGALARAPAQRALIVALARERAQIEACAHPCASERHGGIRSAAHRPIHVVSTAHLATMVNERTRNVTRRVRDAL